MKINCRHCRERFHVADEFAGDARCPTCSRSTPWPPEERGPELPPPASGQSEHSAFSGIGAAVRFFVGLSAAICAGSVIAMLATQSMLATVLAVIFGSIVSVFVYFYPTYTAVRRGHPNALPIFIINLFLGASIIGWAGSLAWAFIAFNGRPSGR